MLYELNAGRELLEPETILTARQGVWSFDVRAATTLSPRTWLSCDVIDSYGALLKARLAARAALGHQDVIIATSFGFTALWPTGGLQDMWRTYPVRFHTEVQKVLLVRKDWVRGRQLPRLQALNAILLPLHLHSSHWALCHLDLRRKRLEYIDGLRDYLDRDLKSRLCHTLKVTLAVIDGRGADQISSRDDDLHGWVWRTWAPGVEVAEQTDGHSCGLLTLYNMASLALGYPMLLGMGAAASHANAHLNNQWRAQVLAEILEGELFHLPSSPPECSDHRV